MKLPSLFIILSALTTLSNAIPDDYLKLVDYANFASFAYCVKKGLTIGHLGDKSTQCNLKICSTPDYSHIEILDTFNYNESNDVGSGYLAIDSVKKRIMLVFRGTSSTRDWLSNVNFFPAIYKPISFEYYPENFLEPASTPSCYNCHVHRGFYRVLKTSLVSVLHGTIKVLEEFPDYEFIIIGHSLGGALATLIGMEFQLMDYKPVVVTFAAPKIGNKPLAHFFDTHFKTEEVAEFIDENCDFELGLIRVTHLGDIVPNLVPNIMYAHSGYEYHINKKKLPHLPDDLIRVGSDFDSMQGFQQVLNVDFTNPMKIAPANKWKDGHIKYFLKLSGCKDSHHEDEFPKDDYPEGEYLDEYTGYPAEMFQEGEIDEFLEGKYPENQET